MSIHSKVGIILLIILTLIIGCETEDVSPPVTTSPTKTRLQPTVTETLTPTSTATPSEDVFEPIEEISFRSGQFRLVGDLQLPGPEGNYPVVIMVHGDGGIDRTCFGVYQPIMERFLNAGYAVFSWDKPGTGESTGQLANHSGKLDQRASILVSAIERLKEHPAINPNQIGAWGHSQGGYVIPLAMRKTNDIVFIIIISGPGEDSYEQGAFLAGQMAFCAGASQAEAKRIEGYLSAIDKATTYQEYYTNATQLLNHPYYDHLDISLSLRSENQWVPEDTDNLAFFNPIDVVEKATIPILVVFGELDRQADPFQGKEAYQEALQKTGVQISQVTLYPDVDHNIVFAKTGCLSERSNRSLSEWMNYTPDYLDLLEAWLVQLHSHLSE